MNTTVFLLLVITIQWQHFVQSQFSGNTLFNAIDIKDAYWHVTFTPESSLLTSFYTPWGRKRFFTNAVWYIASEIVQRRNKETFGDINGVHVIADDPIIADQDDQDHDRILQTVVQRADEKVVKFNKNKI